MEKMANSKSVFLPLLARDMQCFRCSGVRGSGIRH
jgi:hypothetical protein